MRDQIYIYTKKYQILLYFIYISSILHYNKDVITSMESIMSIFERLDARAYLEGGGRVKRGVKREETGNKGLKGGKISICIY